MQVLFSLFKIMPGRVEFFPMGAMHLTICPGGREGKMKYNAHFYVNIFVSVQCIKVRNNILLDSFLNCYSPMCITLLLR